MMRALVLQGGGAKGAYQAGVLKYLLGIKSIKYDILCGTSVGAINAAYLAQFKDGEEVLASQTIHSMWESLDNNAIRKKWFAWPLTVPWKPSVYNSKPLMRLLRENICQEKIANSGKVLRVGAVSLSSGTYETWTESDHDVVEGIIASSAFPGGLIPADVRGKLWMDGGVRRQTPLSEAISLGATHVDVVMCSSPGVDAVNYKNPKSLDVMIRALDIMLDELAVADVNTAYLYNDLVLAGVKPNKRFLELNVIYPSKSIGSTLDFDPIIIRENLSLGFEDAYRKFLL